MLGDAGAQARIVDVGGGTGGLAVQLAELGHRVTVVDPSPDALAALERRAREAGVSTWSPASRATSPTWSTRSSEPTWCSATACSRSSTTPPPRSRASPGCSAPVATLSLLVAQRHAPSCARAMAGHFQRPHTPSTAEGGDRPLRPSLHP